MGWATAYIEKLQAGHPVEFRPRGNSMTPRIHSGDLCRVEPISGAIKKGDIVLCRVGRAQYLHIVQAVQNGRYQIGNNHGGINGWISGDAIYGKLSRIGQPAKAEDWQ